MSKLRTSSLQWTPAMGSPTSDDTLTVEIAKLDGSQVALQLAATTTALDLKRRLFQPSWREKLLMLENDGGESTAEMILMLFFGWFCFRGKNGWLVFLESMDCGRTSEGRLALEEGSSTADFRLLWKDAFLRALDQLWRSQKPLMEYMESDNFFDDLVGQLGNEQLLCSLEDSAPVLSVLRGRSGRVTEKVGDGPRVEQLMDTWGFLCNMGKL